MKFKEEKILMMAMRFYDNPDTSAEDMRSDWTQLWNDDLEEDFQPLYEKILHVIKHFKKDRIWLMRRKIAKQECWIPPQLMVDAKNAGLQIIRHKPVLNDYTVSGIQIRDLSTDEILLGVDFDLTVEEAEAYVAEMKPVPAENNEERAVQAVRFYEEKRAIALLKFSRVYGFLRDRNRVGKSKEAALEFWKETWPEDELTEDTIADCVKYWISACGGNLNNKKVKKLYALRDKARTAVKISEDLQEAAKTKGLKVWHSKDTWKLSGFKIQRGKEGVAGEYYDLTAEEAMTFIEDYKEETKDE